MHSLFGMSTIVAPFGDNYYSTSLQHGTREDDIHKCQHFEKCNFRIQRKPGMLRTWNCLAFQVDHHYGNGTFSVEIRPKCKINVETTWANNDRMFSSYYLEIETRYISPFGNGKFARYGMEIHGINMKVDILRNYSKKCGHLWYEYEPDHQFGDISKYPLQGTIKRSSYRSIYHKPGSQEIEIGKFMIYDNIKNDINVFIGIRK